MNETQNENKRIDLVWLEILKDFWCYVYIAKSLEYTKNIHAKNYVAFFLKTLAPVLDFELGNMIEKASNNNKDKFFVPGMKKIVKKERQHALKEVIVNSSRLPVAEQSMELSFSEKVYDISIMVHDGVLMDMNYEAVLDNIQPTDFWNSLLLSPERVLQALLIVVPPCFGIEIDFEMMFDDLKEELIKTAQLIDEELSSEWFSYSIFKLFSKANSLEREDKIFIMYRYRMITSILKIEKLIPTVKVKSDNFEFDVFISFFKKWKAVIIEITSSELSNLTTEFSNSIKQEIDEKISDKSFFPINRKLRDNIHYEKFDILSENELSLIDEYQSVYFDIVINAFNSVLFVDIDDECKTMTEFVKTCQEKGISQQDLFRNYEKYYRRFLKHKTI